MNYFTDKKSKLISDMGMKCCMEGDLEKGLKYFNTGLELDEDNILLLYNKGGCLISLGETEKAEAVFNRVIILCEEMGKNEFSLSTKANSYLFLQDFENARIVLKELLEIYPDNVDAMINLSQTLNHNLKYDEALEYIDKALNLDPQNPEALMFKGELLFDVFRYAEAREYIDRSFEISSDNHYIWYLKGRCESYDENYEKAVEYYSHAIDLRSDFEKGYYYLAISLIILGRFDEAKATFKKFFEMNPNRFDEEQLEFADELIDMLSQNPLHNDS